MNVENGGELPANDTALADDQAAETQNLSDQTEGLEGEGEEQAPDEVEVEYEGERFKLPSKLKDALLRQQDYTKKTMSLAEERRALEAERETVKSQSETRQAHFQSAARLAAIDEQLETYKGVQSWAAWRQAAYASGDQAEIDRYETHKITFDELREKRDTAARDLSEKERAYRTRTEQETVTRAQKAQAEITRLIPEWAPGNELDQKLAQYGTKLGLEPKALAELAIQHPRLVHEFNRLRLYDEAADKQKTQATFQQTQQAKPVTRVGGSGSVNPRKTTDATGDKLSTDEWMKREAERTRKRA